MHCGSFSVLLRHLLYDLFEVIITTVFFLMLIRLIKTFLIFHEQRDYLNEDTCVLEQCKIFYQGGVAMTFYVGIDIAKFKHDCFIADENGQVIKPSFTFKNDNEGFQLLLETLKPLKSRGIIKIGFESTGHYHYLLKLFLENNNFDYMELNPLLVHKFVSTLTLRRTKTDKKDASMISRYLMTIEYKPYVNKFYHINNLKSLCRLKEKLITEQTRHLNRLTVILDQIFPEFKPFFGGTFNKSAIFILSHYKNVKAISKLNIEDYNKLKATYKNPISYQRFLTLSKLAKTTIGHSNDILEYELQSIISLYNNLNNKIVEMENKIEEIYLSLDYKIHTIKGVGIQSAAIIASEYGNFSRFTTPHQLLAYAGLEPSRNQSGTQDNNGKMVKHGSSTLRATIMRVAETFFIHNPVISDFYYRKRSEGKLHNVALSHVARKLINLIYTLEKYPNKKFDSTKLK